LFLAANKNHAQEKELNVLKGIMEYSISDKSVIPLDIKIFYDKVTKKINLLCQLLEFVHIRG